MTFVGDDHTAPEARLALKRSLSGPALHLEFSSPGSVTASGQESFSCVIRRASESVFAGWGNRARDVPFELISASFSSAVHVSDVRSVCFSALQPSDSASVPSSESARSPPLASGSVAGTSEQAELRPGGCPDHDSRFAASTASAPPLLPENPLEGGSKEVQDWLKRINLLDTAEGEEETSLCLEQEERDAEESPKTADSLGKPTTQAAAEGGLYEKDDESGQMEGLAESRDLREGVSKDSCRWVLFAFYAVRARPCVRSQLSFSGSRAPQFTFCKTVLHGADIRRYPASFRQSCV